MHAEVIAIGDELTSGQRLDTNSRWMATELGFLGVPVTFHTTVPDTLEAGIEAFRFAAARAPIVVVTGGLGPTADDLTRDVLAAVAGVPLDLSADALAAVEARFSKRGMPMPDEKKEIDGKTVQVIRHADPILVDEHGQVLENPIDEIPENDNAEKRYSVVGDSWD
jgi:molybdenum cofactor synthesis domain-containing protein